MKLLTRSALAMIVIIAFVLAVQARPNGPPASKGDRAAVAYSTAELPTVPQLSIIQPNYTHVRAPAPGSTMKAVGYEWRSEIVPACRDVAAINRFKPGDLSLKRSLPYRHLSDPPLLE